MIIRVDGETTVVAGTRVFRIQVAAAVDQARSMRVTITLNGLVEWTFNEPGWRPLSVGFSVDEAYLWSARELIVLPMSVDVDPVVTPVDEDLLLVFKRGNSWLLICETSVRLVSGGLERARLEIGEVIEDASWQGPVLLVRDALGRKQGISLKGDRLSVAG